MRAHKPIVFDTTTKPTNHNFRDITGKRMHMLVVERFAGRRKGRTYWHCRCNCGGESTITAIDFNSGHTRSCGCIQSRITVIRNVAMTTHGESVENSGEYRSWCAMKSRCNNPKNTKYAIYGGRGIKVCDRWNDSYEAFLTDMGRRPSLQYTLDRFPDKDGNYEPGNCRWATYSQQNLNRAPMGSRKPRGASHGCA